MDAAMPSQVGVVANRQNVRKYDTTTELTWNYIRFSVFILFGRHIGMLQEDYFGFPVTKVGMLHLNTFAAQDGSDFREPPNEAPIGRLRQRRPPQRSTAENEAR